MYQKDNLKLKFTLLLDKGGKKRKQKLMKREEKIKRKKQKRINKKRVGKGRKKIKGLIVQMDDYGKKERNWKIHKRQRG